MASMESMTEFFGWMTVISVGVYLLTVIGLILGRTMAFRISAKMFGVPEETVALVSFQYVAAYKLIIITLFFTPYVALKMMS